MLVKKKSKALIEFGRNIFAGKVFGITLCLITVTEKSTLLVHKKDIPRQQIYSLFSEQESYRSLEGWRPQACWVVRSFVAHCNDSAMIFSFLAILGRQILRFVFRVYFLPANSLFFLSI